MEAFNRLVLVIALTILAAGCANLRAVLSPPPPPAKPQVPPAVLAPQVGRAEEDRLRRETNTRIQKTEQIVTRIDRKTLAKDQQEIFSTIQSFITGARGALVSRDFLRASNLADKAHVLAEDLLRSLQ